jgi:hypothetical protein
MSKSNAENKLLSLDSMKSVNSEWSYSTNFITIIHSLYQATYTRASKIIRHRCGATYPRRLS